MAVGSGGRQYALENGSMLWRTVVRSGESGSAQGSRDPLRGVGIRSGESGSALECQDLLRRVGIRSGDSGSAQESRDPLRRVGIRSGESGSAQESRDPLRRVGIRSGESRSAQESRDLLWRSTETWLPQDGPVKRVSSVLSDWPTHQENHGWTWHRWDGHGVAGMDVASPGWMMPGQDNIKGRSRNLYRRVLI